MFYHCKPLLFLYFACLAKSFASSIRGSDDSRTGFVKDSHGYSDRRMRETKAVETGLIVRVIDSNGKQPIQSQATAFNVAFGNTNSAASQFSACSGGDFTFIPYDAQSNGRKGVVDVRLDKPITTYSKGSARTAAEEKLCTFLSGGTCSQSKLNEIDHILYILPGGTTNCNAGGCLFAAVNGQYSVYGDSTTYNKASFSVEGILHEMSHNFKVGHARENGQEYGDDTGQMGASYFLWGANNSDKRCFNGFNMHEMGWQKERQAEIPVGTSCTMNMIGIADLSRSQSSDDYLVARYGDDYFINYNRKVDFNAQTREYPNQILVVKRAPNSPGSTYYDTDLYGKLNVGQSLNREGLTVRVCNRSIVNGAEVMKIAVGAGATCSDRQCFTSDRLTPTGSPTRLPTPSPTPSPTRYPTPMPTLSPTSSPSPRPTPSPTRSPTPGPTVLSTKNPTPSPTRTPTAIPTPVPTRRPSPVMAPTDSPTRRPTPGPTPSPTSVDTQPPVDSTFTGGFGLSLGAQGASTPAPTPLSTALPTTNDPSESPTAFTTNEAEPGFDDQSSVTTESSESKESLSLREDIMEESSACVPFTSLVVAVLFGSSWFLFQF